MEIWNGGAVDEVGIVREGVKYGPKDYNCKEMSKFVRSCGHEEKVSCKKAFEMAQMMDLSVQQPCLVRVPVSHPHCGHQCEITCVDKGKLDTVERLTNVPIDEVHEGASKFPNNLPRGMGKCTEQVTLYRTCGHKTQVACGAARGTQTRCKEEITIKSPLCGHDITIPCWRRNDIESWHPWNESTYESLRLNSSLLADAKTNIDMDWPNTDVLSMLKCCPGFVTVSKSCGHQYKERCSELIPILRNGGRSKKGASCTEVVQRELPCGHEVTVMCKEWQKFADQKTEIRCRAIVEQESPRLYCFIV